MNDDNLVFSCIVINMNGEKWLKDLFKSLKLAISETNITSFEVIMVDNNSTDLSIDIFEKEMGSNFRFKLIKNKTNIGWSPAVNQGLRSAKGEILIFLSNDMEVERLSITNIIARFKALPNVGILQFNSISIFDRISQDSGRNYIDPMGFIYGYKVKGDLDYVSFAEGMAFAIRHKVVEDVGEMDESYFMMYDDVDYSWRTRMMGWEIAVDSKSVVYHYRGGTVGSNFGNMNPKFIMLATRNHITTLIKNTEFHNLLLVLPYAIIIKVFESIYLIFKVNIVKGLYNLYGILSVFSDIRTLNKKRRKVQELRIKPDIKIYESFHTHNLRMLVHGSILSNPSTRGKLRESNEVAITYR